MNLADATVIILTGSGKKYPITEKSRHKELIKKIQAESNKIKINPRRYPVVLKRKPLTVRKDQTRSVDTSYRQPNDIVNSKGKLVIAKGTKIEPLKYLRLPALIVVNDESAHLHWAYDKKIALEKEGEDAFILITDGNAYDVAEKYQIKVYHLSDRIMSHFHIERVPCIVRQRGLQLEIHEYAL